MLDMSEVPTEAFEYIVSLRREAAKYRAQRRELRTTLAAAQAEVASLRLDVADLKDGILPAAAR